MLNEQNGSKIKEQGKQKLDANNQKDLKKKYIYTILHAMQTHCK